jgi:NADH dehydrogenase
MRIAIFGATGFVGSHLVDHLTTAGHEVSILVRNGSDRKLLRTDYWRRTSGDIGDEQAISATLAECDAAVISIGILRESRRHGITFEALQYDSVVRVTAAAKAANVQRIILISANGIRNPGTPYQETKYRAEQHLRDSGLDVTILQPSIIFGDPRGCDEIATRLLREMVAPPIPAVGFFSGLSIKNGQVLMSPVHIEDVAAVAVGVLTDPEASGQTYELGGPEVVSWSDMIRRIGVAVGRPKWIIPMPVALMKAAAFLFDWLPFFPVTRDQLTMLAENNIASDAIVRKYLSREPQHFAVPALSYLTRN